MLIPQNRHRTVAVAALMAVLALVGCDRRDDTQTTGQKVDAAIGKADEKLGAAKADVQREAERAKQATGDAAQAATAAVTDAAITTGIKAKLFADAQLKARDIHVQTHAGLAALQGTVPDEASRSRASQLAATVQGVTSVDNQLTVAP
jgi:hyperosmotically inducible periplasmic protein